MSHHTIWGCLYLHELKYPEQLPQRMNCVGALKFGLHKLGLSRFDSVPSNIYYPHHDPVHGTYQRGPSTSNNGPESNESSSLGLIQTHTEKLRVWQEYKAVDRAIKRVIKTILPKVYFWTLQNRHTRCETTSILYFLIHLHATYDMLKDEYIQAIDTEMKAPINGETHFEYLVTQIEYNQEAVATQNLYTTG